MAADPVYARRQEGRVIDCVRHGLRAVATAYNEPRADHDVGSRPTIRARGQRTVEGGSA
jgi:hypothetical protein